MSLKIEFVEKASQPGAKIAGLCRQYKISRETGYKWLKRFKKWGYEGLNEQSRRPKSSPLALGEDLGVAIIEAKEKYPYFGPDKIRTVVGRQFPQVPSRATVARILKRIGRVTSHKRRRALSVVSTAPNVIAQASNDIWTVDFKGYWYTLDAEKCNPLTVRDAYSRFVLCIRSLPQGTIVAVKAEFEKLFLKYGIPKIIQCDNGTPFICSRARGGISKLTAWWISLGIQIIRSRPGNPQDNGGHERMHKDIAIQVEAHPSANHKAEQRALDKFKQEFNHVRPHDALSGKTPAEVYKPSACTALLQKAFLYPHSWCVVRVNKNGMIRMQNEPYYLGEGLCGQTIALEPLGGLVWNAWFGNHSLGEIEIWPDDERLLELTQLKISSPQNLNHPGKRRAA